VQALVDTGASTTVIRRADYLALRLRKTGDEEDIGGIGSATMIPTAADITLEGTLYPNFPVLAATDDDFRVILIGRDLLNLYLLECDGRRQEFSIT
jgi:predicted aspartyl protease